MITTELTTREQVRQALVLFQEAHEEAEDAAAAFYDLDKQFKVVRAQTEAQAEGPNEKARAAAARSVLEADYGDLLTDHEAAEKRKAATAAHLERSEKNLNVGRELLNHETAELNRGTATERAMAATIEDTTAQRYAVLGSRRTLDTTSRYSVKPTNGTDDPESLLPF